jgi:hypothetical protein
MIWDHLGIAIKASVDSFNRLYRQSKNALEYQARDHSVFLSIQLPARDVEAKRYASAKISFDRKHYVISCRFQKIDAPEVIVSFGAASDSEDLGGWEVFLQSHPDGPRIKDEDSASRLMLRTFFKAIQNA